MTTKLLIAGMPAAGKTTFGGWLANNHSFCHIDAELPQDNRLDALGLRAAWETCVNGHGAQDFSAALESIGPTVFDWGLPPSCLELARSLKAAGFGCWWFDADEPVVRAAFRQRGTGSIGSLETQLAAIRGHRAEVMELFQPNVIVTIDETGVRMSPEAIWQTLRP